jgi:hypothetical protein
MCWRVVAASCVGTSHIATGMPCQDCVGAELFESQHETVLIAVVSDGAGSAAHSEVGSSRAVETTRRLARNYLSNHTIASFGRKTAEDWLSAIQADIHEIAEQHSAVARDFACTLLVAIVGADAAVFLQVGDGAIVVTKASESREWSPVFWPQHGEYVNTTNFVTMANAAEVLDFVVLNERIDGLASFSDGLENLVLDQATRGAHTPFFNSMIGQVQQQANRGVDEHVSRMLQDYLSSEKVCQRTDDDKSLILAARIVLDEEPTDASSDS